MLATAHREAVIEMPFGLEEIKERMPSWPPLFASHECVHVADKDNPVAGTGDENVKALRSGHEPDVPRLVAAGERSNHNVTLFTLVIVCDGLLAWLTLEEKTKQTNRRYSQRLFVKLCGGVAQQACPNQLVLVHLAQSRIMIVLREEIPQNP